MFCPNCGEQENNPVQFCRACGANLSAVRDSLAESDNYTALTINAREEIARAAATKIKEGNWWQVGMITSEVGKLFESPPERRLRQQMEVEERRLKHLREGTITAGVGIGLALFSVVASFAIANAIFLVGPALFVLLVGLSIVINGLYFSVPKIADGKKLNSELAKGGADQLNGYVDPNKSLASPGRPFFEHSSVTEGTTRHLKEDLYDEKRDTNKIGSERHSD